MYKPTKNRGYVKHNTRNSIMFVSSYKSVDNVSSLATKARFNTKYSHGTDIKGQK